jgi:hypothetical protein
MGDQGNFSFSEDIFGRATAGKAGQQVAGPPGSGFISQERSEQEPGKQGLQPPGDLAPAGHLGQGLIGVQAPDPQGIPLAHGFPLAGMPPGTTGVCVFLASGYGWVTVIHEIPISSAYPLMSLPYPRTR